MSDSPATAPSLRSLLERARVTRDPGPLVDSVPCARFLGLSASLEGERLVLTLRFAPHIVGNSHIPALHGGAVAALLESVAFFQLVWEAESAKTPRIIGITVDYVRTARTVETYARAAITRQGRRIATVHTEAWQDDAARPVATARAHFLLTPRETPPPAEPADR